MRRPQSALLEPHELPPIALGRIGRDLIPYERCCRTLRAPLCSRRPVRPVAPPHPHEHRHRRELREHAECDSRVYRMIVQNAYRGAAQEPEDAISRGKEPEGRGAPFRAHHWCDGCGNDRLVHPHAEPPDGRPGEGETESAEEDERREGG